MPTRFYHPRRQWLVGDEDSGGLVMLPQFGSPSGGTHRPLNAFALVFVEDSGVKALLIDAPLRHALPGVRGLAEAGAEVVGCVLTHADVAAQADATDVLADRFACPYFLHPGDRRDPRLRHLRFDWRDPCEDGAFGGLPAACRHWPGHSPGSVLVETGAFGGVLLTGDSAVAPGPMQPDDAAPLTRPPAPGPGFSPTDEEVCARWRALLAEWERTAAPRTLAPLHGEVYANRDDIPELVRGLLAAGVMDGAVRRTA